MKAISTILRISYQVLVLPLLLLCSTSHAQTREIDSTLAFIASYKKDDTVKVKALLQVSSTYQTLNLIKAREYANKAKAIAERKGFAYYQALAVSRLASIAVWDNKTTDALNGYFKEIDIGNNLASNYILQDAYDGIAYVYEIEKDWQRSLQYAQKSLAIAQQSTSVKDAAYPYHQMGSVYLGQGNNHDAEQYLKKAKRIFELTKDTDRIALCHVDLAKVYTNLGYFNLARPHLDTALNLFTKWNEYYQVAETYHQYALLNFKQNQYDEAEKSFTKELDLYERYPGAPGDHANAAIGIARVALAKKDNKRAVAILTNEIAVLQMANEKESQLECLHYLASADSAMNNFKDAFFVMQRYKLLFDAVTAENKDRAAQRLLLELGIERQTNESKILQTKYDEAESKLIIILVAGVLLLLGVILLVLLYRQKSAAFKSIEKLQEETSKKNRELGNSNNVKDKLISMIAHDVRSPLASVQNTLTLTREGILTHDEFMQLTKMLEMDIQHLMGMLDNTLLWAREQMIDINVKKGYFDIYKLLNDVAELYKQTIISKGVTIYNNVPPGTQVFSDIDIISTVLRNILSNAVKFTPQGKSIYIEKSSIKNKILVSVRDEGVGITDDVLKKINNKEFISTRGTDNEKGTGLGLLFSRDLLIKLNEDFQISSVLGKGTAITISLSTHE